MNRGNLLKPNMDLKLTKIQKLREAEVGWSTKLTTRSTLNLTLDIKYKEKKYLNIKALKSECFSLFLYIALLPKEIKIVLKWPRPSSPLNR